MYTTSMYVFLNLKPYFAKMVDLISLMRLVAAHMGCGNYVAICAEQ